ncbi:MAG: restriction modification system specificity domain protein [Verrucomicrobiales bacterium]|nr:restriction modification system specificity domain protein [Verrucomicrobiales bacterium]
MSFPRYPKYKPSGVEWLGDVPEHWGIDRIKRSTIASQNGIWGDEPQQDENDIPCVRVADFDRQRLRVQLKEPTIRNVTAKEREGRVLSQGDLLLEKSGGGENQPVGCVVLYDDTRPAVCSNFVARVKVAPEANNSFWRYLHAAAYAVRLNTRSIKQTSGIQNLDASQYFDERAGFPPLSEQTAIATFLYRDTAKIDSLITEQQRLIELLKEKRQAVISHAVTKGLNPNVPMKPSGIEWLGDVPAHWQIRRLKQLAQKLTDGEHISPSICQDGIPLLSAKDVRDWAIDYQIDKFVTIEDANQFWKRCRPEKGDVLVVSRGATVGRIGVVTQSIPFCLMGSVILCKPLQDYNATFLYYALNAKHAQTSLWFSSASSAQQAIYIRDVAEVTLPLPPSAERAVITEFLTSETAKLDTLTTEAQRAIDLLQERRTALISAAVTGQIDVRLHNSHHRT